MTTTIVRRLRRLAEDGASGELIGELGGVEVHVYLHRGRVAWATDSEHPSAFTRYIEQSGRIDRRSLGDIVESCRRERRVLSDTLVSLGVVTMKEVRDALRHQLTLTLGVLRRHGAAQSLFLDRTRQFAAYDETLTFELRELLPAGGHMAGRLVENVKGAAWAELLDGARVIDAAPAPARAARVPTEVVASSTLDGAELVMRRSSEGILAGVTLGGRRSLWSHLEAGVPFGGAVSALASFGAFEAQPAAARESGKRWSIACETEAAEVLDEQLARAPEVLAAVVTSPDGADGACTAGAGAFSIDETLDLVRRREPLLRDGEGAGSRTLVTTEPHVLCLATELGTAPRRIAWLLVERTTALGLGLAHLASVGRRLAQVRDWPRP